METTVLSAPEISTKNTLKRAAARIHTGRRNLIKLHSRPQRPRVLNVPKPHIDVVIRLFS
jgi:hypothetical protein